MPDNLIGWPLGPQHYAVCSALDARAKVLYRRARRVPGYEAGTGA
ncbi:hypothetical protein FHS42_005371 [Streptomyces zagrosensis]|uniref:Uncharacterized protein n=1 Tax=Streptomyces zagrosensis TaxID=1042984 RepID=A0A7W9V0K8_9ACTN|nr:hypothetical protein [Streptomyces zagrosensis]